VDAAGEAVRRYTRETARHHLAAGKVVGTIGGDHSVPLGAIEAHVEHHGELGILHLDAHADLRVAYEGFTYSHASIMERVLAELPGVTRLVQVGIRDLGAAELAAIQGSGGRVRTLFDPAIARARLSGRLLEAFRDAVSLLPDKVYLSFDVDGLDPRLCPSTGTPVPGGIDLAEASLLLEAVVDAGKTIVGFDLCEVAPGPEGDEWDGNVGARLLYKMIGWTLQSRAPTHRALAASWIGGA
jgi:agmatinase